MKRKKTKTATVDDIGVREGEKIEEKIGVQIDDTIKVRVFMDKRFETDVNVEVDRETYGRMRLLLKEGQKWYAYRNEAMDSFNLGHIQFLKVGKDCTHEDPPDKFPMDNEYGMGWRYMLVGYLELSPMEPPMWVKEDELKEGEKEERRRAYRLTVQVLRSKAKEGCDKKNCRSESPCDACAAHFALTVYDPEWKGDTK